MAEHIDREDAIEAVLKIPCKIANHKGKMIALIERLPAADVVEVKHGKWISASKKQGVNIGMKCSICGARIKYSEFFNGNHNYCHKCGAKMDKG